ncbi:MAG: hypothetical protein GY730_05070 [bacterium]|nr:hypothetical protein [bacterium]
MEYDNKKIWQEEAKQLKRDLDSRPEIIQKREVEIKLGTKASKKTSSNFKSGSITGNSKINDEYMRRNLRL